jgi:hypothetical protein
LARKQRQADPLQLDYRSYLVRKRHLAPPRPQSRLAISKPVEKLR